MRTLTQKRGIGGERRPKVRVTFGKNSIVQRSKPLLNFFVLFSLGFGFPVFHDPWWWVALIWSDLKYPSMAFTILDYHEANPKPSIPFQVWLNIHMQINTYWTWWRKAWWSLDYLATGKLKGNPLFFKFLKTSSDFSSVARECLA